MTEDKQARKRAHNQRYYAKYRAKILSTAKKQRASDPERFRQTNRRYYAKNKEVLLRWARAHALRKKYGITEADFEAMLVRQGWKCAICRRSDPCGNGTFHVDHCHETGRVRGLLCHHCNVGIGSLREDPEILMNAIKYLIGELA
jgi:hypothetical protein